MFNLTAQILRQWFKSAIKPYLTQTNPVTPAAAPIELTENAVEVSSDPVCDTDAPDPALLDLAAKVKSYLETATPGIKKALMPVREKVGSTMILENPTLEGSCIYIYVLDTIHPVSLKKLERERDRLYRENMIASTRNPIVICTIPTVTPTS